MRRYEETKQLKTKAHLELRLKDGTAIAALGFLSFALFSLLFRFCWRVSIRKRNLQPARTLITNRGPLSTTPSLTPHGLEDVKLSELDQQQTSFRDPRAPSTSTERAKPESDAASPPPLRANNRRRCWEVPNGRYRSPPCGSRENREGTTFILLFLLRSDGQLEGDGRSGCAIKQTAFQLGLRCGEKTPAE